MKKKNIMAHHLPDVYLSLGGNIGNSVALLRSAMRHIAVLDGISEFKASRFYKTSPVGGLPQDDYVNCACCFKSAMEAKVLLVHLQAIEKAHGKAPKEKNAPRAIDIDIVFFGTERYSLPELEVPHPSWKDRLFVIQPLSDLAASIPISDSSGRVERIDIEELKRTFPNLHHETVSCLLDEAEGELCLSSK